MKTACIRLLLFSLPLSSSALAMRPSDFKVIGPGGSEAMFNPTVSPHDPNGSSVWHGSLLGRDEPLDIATPELQPGRQ